MTRHIDPTLSWKGWLGGLSGIGLFFPSVRDELLEFARLRDLYSQQMKEDLAKKSET